MTKGKIDNHKLFLDDDDACDDPKNISRGKPPDLFFFSILLDLGDGGGIGGIGGNCDAGTVFFSIPFGRGFRSIGGGLGRGFCCQKRRGEIVGTMVGAVEYG